MAAPRPSSVVRVRAGVHSLAPTPVPGPIAPPFVPLTAAVPRRDNGGPVLDAALKATRLGRAFDEGRLTDPQRVRLGRAIASRAKAAARSATADLVAGRVTLPQWHRSMKAGILASHGAATRAWLGTRNLAPADRNALERRVARQFTFLDRFANRLKSGEIPLGPRAVAIAGLYGSAAWSTAQDVAADRAKRQGQTQARSVLGLADHCGSCLTEAGKGWTDAADLTPIGDRQCKSNCRCHLEFRQAPTAQPRPRPAPTPIVHRAEGGATAGLTFVPAKHDAKRVVVHVDVRKLDASLARNRLNHVGPMGSGGIGDRYRQALDFLGKAKAESIPVEMTRVAVDPRTGQATIGDGRHRFAALRDSGATVIPVVTDREAAARLHRLYGAEAAPGVARARAKGPAGSPPARPAFYLQPIDMSAPPHPDTLRPVPPPLARRLADYTAGDEKVARLARDLTALKDEHTGISDAIEAHGAETRKLIQKAARLDRQILSEKTADARKALLDTERRDLKARILARDEERAALYARRREIEVRTRAHTAHVLAVDQPLPITWQHGDHPGSGSETLSALDPATATQADAAAAWVSKITRVGEEGGLDYHIGARPGLRAYHSADGHIGVRPGELPETIVHELGHAIETRVRGPNGSVLDRSQEFLAHRVGDEAPVPMNSIPGAGRYAGDEFGRSDRFGAVFSEPGEAHYVGKDYGRHATEILSMGLEKLYKDAHAFVTKDPEYAKYVIGILHGDLR